MRFLFAHGAGADKDSDFIITISQRLSKSGIEVIRFNFPYMEERALTGLRRPPDRSPVLEKTWRHIIAEYGRSPFFIGGKSMGGRIASLVAKDSGASGLICLGFPFHAPGKPLSPSRRDHLLSLSLPVLIVQGTRDAMGSHAELGHEPWPSNFSWHWLPDGDHSFNPRKASGHRLAEHLNTTARLMVEFMAAHSR